MYKILNDLKGPEDIKGFDADTRTLLAEEIRDRIMRVVSKNGGHFGSNFGVVELTIALHTVFDSPRDRILFDTSHQCYPHKLLTGRNDIFDSLRTYQGMSGFCHKDESEHDVAFAGHAGTIASIALGVAAGDDIAGNDRHVVAVVGDSSIVSGMSFEAMNHAGHIKKKLLIILNDNDMSISYPVGGLHRTLDRIRTNPLYTELKKDIESVIDRIPVIGETLHGGLSHLKDTLKHGLMAGRVFEDLGLSYYGPVDGHDTEELIRVLREVRDIDGPVLLHIMTKKGAGWAPALSDPVKWHAAKDFLDEDKDKDKDTKETVKATEAKVESTAQDRAPSPTRVEVKEDGKVEKPMPSSGSRWTSVFDDALMELAEQDPSIVALTAAMPGGTGLSRFASTWPERFFDVGIAEQHGTGFASGLRLAGLRPVFAVYSTFLQRGFDQVVHDVCIQNNPVTFCLDRAGLVGADGVTHQGLFDIAYLRGIPRTVLLAPADADELKAMLKWSIESDLITFLRWPRATAPRRLKPSSEPIRLGQGEVLVEGEEVCLFAYGAMVELALAAADLLKREGIRPTVVNARFAKPFPVDLLAEMASGHRLVLTLEDHAREGGFGAAAAQALLDKSPGLVEKLRIRGVTDEFVDHGDRSLQLRDQGLDVSGIVASVKEALVESTG